MKEIIQNILHDNNIKGYWKSHKRFIVTKGNLNRDNLTVINNNLPQEVDYTINFEMEGLTLYFHYE